MYRVFLGLFVFSFCCRPVCVPLSVPLSLFSSPTVPPPALIIIIISSSRAQDHHRCKSPIRHPLLFCPTIVEHNEIQVSDCSFTLTLSAPFLAARSSFIHPSCRCFSFLSVSLCPAARSVWQPTATATMALNSSTPLITDVEAPFLTSKLSQRDGEVGTDRTF